MATKKKTSAPIDPTPADEAKDGPLVEYSLALAQDARLIWAANYFVLWPLGITLAYEVDSEDALKIPKNLHFRHYEGLPLETIEASTEENNDDYRVFLDFVRDRLVAMKPADGRSLVIDYMNHSIAGIDQIMFHARKGRGKKSEPEKLLDDKVH